MRFNILLFLLLTVHFCSGQKNSRDTVSTRPALKQVSAPALNSLFLEFVGNAGAIASANYERQFLRKKKNYTDDISLRIGIASGTPFNKKITIPLMIDFSSNPGHRHHFERGIGVVFEYGNINAEAPDGSSDDHTLHYALAGRIMYKYTNEESGTLFKVGWTPCIYDDIGNNYGFFSQTFYRGIFLLSFGIDVGFTFTDK